MLVLFGSIAIAPGSPIASIGSWSVSGVQLTPASIVFHTPPSVAPREITFGLFGLTAIESIRPFHMDVPAVIPLGPIGFQTNPVTLLARVLAFGAPRLVTGDPVEIAAHSFMAFW